MIFHASSRPAARALWRMRRAFTLIEIMIVIGIIAMVAAIGLPTFAVAFNQTPMRKAITDVMQGLRDARRLAIETDQPADFVLNIESKSFSVARAPVDASAAVNHGLEEGHAFKPISGTLGDDIFIELVYLFDEDWTPEPEVRVRFYPNGTSDDFKLVLRSVDNEIQVFTLEVVTGMAMSKRADK